MEKTAYIVSPENSHERLDSFISAFKSGLSRSYVQKLIKQGLVAVNAKIEKASYKLKNGDRIDLAVPDEPEDMLIPEDLPLDIIYEDEYIIVVNKPPQMVVHPGAGNKGRFRFDIGKGNFLPPTRVYQCVSRNGTLQLPNQSGLNGAPLPGLLVGQYHAPEFGFQFPDSVPGVPVMPNNFNVLPFLTQGEGGNPSAGPLIPQPPVTP